MEQVVVNSTGVLLEPWAYSFLSGTRAEPKTEQNRRPKSVDILSSDSMNEKNGTVEVDFTFPHSYEVQELQELPATGKLDVPLLYIPQPKTRSEHDGVWLKIRSSNGEPWVGVFAFGYSSPSAVSRVISTPDPEALCVVSRGAAYIVRPDEPNAWQQMRVLPIIDVRVLPEHQMLLLADYTKLIALGNGGVLWKSSGLCGDDLKILRITSKVVEGTGYGPASSGESRFSVDIKTGRSLLRPTSLEEE